MEARVEANVKGNAKPLDLGAESGSFVDLLLDPSWTTFLTRFEPAVVETFHTSYINKNMYLSYLQLQGQLKFAVLEL